MTMIFFPSKSFGLWFNFFPYSALPRTSNIKLSSNSESEHPVLFLVLDGIPLEFLYQA